MNEVFETTGGAKIGWVNASWPLAKLTATSDALRLDVRILGSYHFTPDNVVAITRYSIIPILGWGILIQHCVPEYPTRVVFWCLGNPNTLLTGIRESGFFPRATPSDLPPRRGFALRWQAIVIAVASWNGMFIAVVPKGPQPRPPGPLMLLPLVLTIAASIAAIRVPAFQKLILKPGRSIGELRPFLNFLLFVLGIMVVAFSLITVFQPPP